MKECISTINKKLRHLSKSNESRRGSMSFLTFFLIYLVTSSTRAKFHRQVLQNKY